MSLKRLTGLRTAGILVASGQSLAQQPHIPGAEPQVARVPGLGAKINLLYHRHQRRAILEGDSAGSL